MTARRQGSRTSLDKYARLGANSPTKNLTMDFCNSFWGLGDAGVDVLFTRLRGGMRTIDELKTYFTERCAIEEEYSKRLTKLSNMTLGRDEIGETREALDAIRLETGRQAGFHTNLARNIRNELEAPTTAFYNKQLDLKKNSQAKVEHEFRAKQLQEDKVLEKYEQERDQTHGREFPGLARAYGDTARRWESVWKDFCDQAQDVEEERLDFVKEILWSYANAISTVCVADDESCENWRTLLEQVDLDRDMENFVRDYGTGNQIPDPMAFLRQNSSDGGPSSSSSSSSKVTTHPARFNRISRRGPSAPNQTPPADAEVKSTQGQSSSRQTNGSSASVSSPGPSSRKSLSSDSQPPGSSSLNRHDTLTHQIDEFQKVVAGTSSPGPSGLESPTSPTLGRNVAELAASPQRPGTGSSNATPGFKGNHSPKSSQIISSPIDQAHVMSKGSPQQSPRTPSSVQGSISKTANAGGSGASTSPSSLAPRLHDEAELPPTPLSGHYIPPPPQQPPPQPSPAQQRRSWTAPAPPPAGPIPNLPGPPPPLPPQPSHTLVDPPHNPPQSPHYYQSPAPPVQQGYQPSSPYINGSRSPAAGYNPPRAPSPQRQQPHYQLPQPQSRPPLTVQVASEPDRPPSPLGTGQVTEEGMPILFYVQAIYDYTATIEEEFDFTTGDIIAVTATPEDGWWSGELLDENRRQKGRNVFPSNFVSLLE